MAMMQNTSVVYSGITSHLLLGDKEWILNDNETRNFQETISFDSCIMISPI